jgi:hypothetical protein
MKNISKLITIFFLFSLNNLLAQSKSNSAKDSTKPSPTANQSATSNPKSKIPPATSNSDSPISLAYKNALESFHKGNPKAAISELNSNCIPHIKAGDSFIYKAYKLLITCYQNIDKDKIANDNFIVLREAVKKDSAAVQHILDKTTL